MTCLELVYQIISSFVITYGTYMDGVFNLICLLLPVKVFERFLHLWRLL
jgi:hypothetical protein